MNSTNQTSFIYPPEKLATLNWVQLYIHDVIGCFLFIFGIIFNLLSFTYFQLSRSFKDTSMRHYFSVISLTDSSRLAEWLFAFLANRNFFEPNELHCRINLFIYITSGHISTWLLVFLSIERYVILQFPFRGKRIYTTRNSLRMLCIVIISIFILDLPYLLPDFITKTRIEKDLHLVNCVPNLTRYFKYIFANNVIIYSFLPFIILLIFNSLLITVLARQKTQFKSVIQSNNSVNAKRERQFKETTILLIGVTFFLIITVSPRYIYQQKLRTTPLNKPDYVAIVVAISKILNILEMLNFSFNFFFYIMCSKTSRKEFYLLAYYFFYWKWSQHANKIKICNHPEHNQKLFTQRSTISRNNPNCFRGSFNSLSHNSCNVQIDERKNSNIYRYFKRQSRLKIYCFLEHAARIKSNSYGKSSIHASLVNNHNIINDSSITSHNNNNRHNSNLNIYGSEASFESRNNQKKKKFAVFKKKIERKKSIAESVCSTQSNFLTQKNDFTNKILNQNLVQHSTNI
ncbi:unnamed protein product [Brachionus calyciflorus]|uniref:G-protein coupled receptors family 1 profile domain-containing protein n=1 Tax=Brachionus calyciflorus TaxID=104777 RepID=A0A813M366_9BILA|nr:unnamed protein product [Brachionus calyciflorus]